MIPLLALLSLHGPANPQSAPVPIESTTDRVVPLADGFRLENQRQAWTTTFDERGFLVRPDSDAWTWGLRLANLGFGSQRVEGTSPSCTSGEGSKVTYHWTPEVIEWFVQDERGIEHGFDLLAPPEGLEVPSEFVAHLEIRGSLLPLLFADGTGARFLQPDGQLAVTYSGLHAFDATGRILKAGMKLSGDYLVIRADLEGAVYPVTVDPVAERDYLKASEPGAGDGFGIGLAASGNTIIVGARGEDSNETGTSATGTDNSAPQAGAAYVFVQTPGGWRQEAILKASNTEADDFFGVSVDIDGDTAVIGATDGFLSTTGESSDATGVDGDQFNNNAPGSGAAYVFRRTGTTWSQEAYLKAFNTDSLDHFGLAVAIDGDRIAVGAPDEASSASGVGGDQSDNSAARAGAVYTFIRTGTTWTPEAYVKPSNMDAGDQFGFALDLEEDTLVVGAVQEDGASTGVGGDDSSNAALGSGAAYVFARNSGVWSQQAYLKASNAEADDQFGRRVSLNGNHLAVSAIGECSGANGVDGDESDNSLQWAGAVYMFERSGTAWTQTAYLKASNTGSQDLFGRALSLSEDFLIVSATGECGIGNGVDAIQTSTSPCFEFTGAVYVFEPTATSWVQTSYIKASHPGVHDSFGAYLAVGDGFLVVTAPFEDSNAIGLNGDPTNGDRHNSGAAFLYELNVTSTSAGTSPHHCSGYGNQPAGCADCPCGNNTPTTQVGGCLNSTGAPGSLVASGSTSASPISADQSLRFELTGVQPGAFAVLLSSDSIAPDSPSHPCFGANNGLNSSDMDGLICAVQHVTRHGGRFASVNGDVGVVSSPWGGEHNPPSTIVQDAQFVSGQKRYFQALYRDDPTLSCGRGLNSTQAIEITFTP